MEDNPLAGCILPRRYGYKPCIVGVGSARRTPIQRTTNSENPCVYRPLFFIEGEQHGLWVRPTGEFAT